MLFHVFADLLKGEIDPLPKVRLLIERRPYRVLQLDDIPMLVHFSDPNDPKSVVQVDPANLQATFGAEVVLRDVTIEVTEDPISRAVETKLPWLKTIQGQLDGSHLYTGGSFANELNAYDFYRGSK